jgi:hypothetical protein
VDANARSRVLELRSTALPSVGDWGHDGCNSTIAPESDALTINSAEAERQDERLWQPYLSPEDTHRRVMHIAKRGETIGILGSGWDAVDLVVSVAAGTKSSSKPTIVFGASGPLSHVLPNYLSTAVSKRLQAKRIQVLDRSLVRYISSDSRKSSRHALQLYTAKSFDFLDGKTTTVDWVVVAPEVQGPRGNAALATDEVPDFLDNDSDEHDRPWYQTWAGLSMQSPSDPSLVVCYKDDGRVAVNTELYACHGLYAAGSVAKCANSLTGNATVAGSGVENAKDAGFVAAANMALDFGKWTANTKTVFGYQPDEKQMLRPIVKDPIPIWRSDLRTAQGIPQDQQTALADIGIVALCVGNCDSESLTTHGVWWTNQAAQQRLLGLVDSDSNDDQLDERRRRLKKVKRGLKPVYGLGVVYYLDRTGRIRGVMTWGLPFHAKHALNEELLVQMKRVVTSNGGFRSLETEQDQLKMSAYLSDVSKQMVMTAFRGQTGSTGVAHKVDGALDTFPRPLHRYTDIRPPQVRNVGVLKRKDGQGNGILGEDLFVRYSFDEIPDTPVPLPHPTANVGSAVAKVEARYVWDVWEQKERRWDENESRARPPKEDTIWIRKGDEARSTSQSERLATAYRNAFNNPR